MLKAKVKKLGRRITVGEDKAYDTVDHVTNLRAINVTPHVAQNDSITSTGKRRRSAIDGRTTRHQGYGMSQSCRASYRWFRSPNVVCLEKARRVCQLWKRRVHDVCDRGSRGRCWAARCENLADAASQNWPSFSRGVLSRRGKG
jgi:hypothetical protein